MNNPELHRPVRHYGPLGFAAALTNILVIEFVTWTLLPWFYLAVFLIPALLVDLGVSAFLASRHGRLREIGRGMIIGCIAGPAALIFFIPLYLLVQGVGLI
ncbi:hypothetical protein [Mycolicibacterium sp. P1-18]|uniref:hypothetical protein n=1 Tax=Mycolicibacterium sp. P1-18 TaxID=2024615 RepID=UPI0011F3C5F3|nr:hypothetical protein [Mycolicibacterium sp. P1-18]